MDFFVDFLSNNFQNCIWLAIILVALCPTLEAKIAVPLAMNTDIWGSGAFSPWTAFLLAYVGSLLPSFLILFISRKIKNKTTGFISSKLVNHYANKSLTIEQKGSNFKKYLALAGFVSVPLPLTGIWSGSFIAGLTSLNLKYSFLSIAIGSLISTGVITILCTIFTNSILYILIASFAIIIVFLIIDFLISFFKSKKMLD